eukprot:TRINITY_DN26273_c0_g5_i1.p1 TRINITY_DN26273_c0_g5~~TRINITY_DN26273_c0_g5_i1.p1  ORF type:complete len:577 (-),score=38.16 TRINITY_DN26273_c0_g5_i1:240-1970(-)
MVWRCDICSISCPSDYQKQQHLAGAKHAAKLKARDAASRRDSGGVPGTLSLGSCFAHARGQCNKGGACPYSHAKDAPAAGRMPSMPSFGPDARAPCFAFARGRCDRGSNCTYSHQNDRPVSMMEIGKMTGADATETASVMVGEGTPQLISSTSSTAPSVRPDARIGAQFHIRKEEETVGTFPDKYRDALKRKQNVNMCIVEGRVIMQFAYNELVKEAVKAHVKGRQWEPKIGDKGCWTCPLESLPDAVALWEHMGRKVEPALKERAKKVRDTYGGSDSITLRLELPRSPFDNQDANFGSIIVSFQYNAALVSAVKQLAPIQRSYDSSTKTWDIRLFALSEFLQHIQPLGYTQFPETLSRMSSLVSKIEQLLFEADDYASASSAATCGATDALNDAKSNYFAALWRELLFFARHHTNEDQVDRSSCGHMKRRKLTAHQKAWASGLGAESSDDESDDFLSSVDFRRALGRFATDLRSSPIPKDCDCGQPHRLVGGRHHCRYFGTFNCDCGNSWTSAYCWKGEKQACRGCNVESLPIKKEKLDGRIGGGSGAPHDSSRCSKCRALGYDCSAAHYSFFGG